jgi:hypothetical protein
MSPLATGARLTLLRRHPRRFVRGLSILCAALTAGVVTAIAAAGAATVAVTSGPPGVAYAGWPSANSLPANTTLASTAGYLGANESGNAARRS